MSLTKFLIEESALVVKFKISQALFKGELITTLESLMGLTISSSDLVVLPFCASLSKLLISITSKRQVRSGTIQNLNICRIEMVLRQRYVFLTIIEYRNASRR
jgi:hypothetical protein